MRPSSIPLVLAAAAALCACSAASPPPPRLGATSAQGGGAHDLVLQAASCWTDGLWSDALGETGDARLGGIERRCDELLAAGGVTPEQQRYYPLRAVEPYVVNVLAARVRELAAADPEQAPHAAQLEALLRGIADAARENVDARRAADVVKDDVEGQPEPDARAADKVAAAARLRDAESLDALFHLDAGPYTADAHAVALLLALDRMEIARGLPKHLKVYAVGGALHDVFGVPAPAVSDRTAAPIPSGTWLRYLTEVAAAAGHPVPADAHDPQNREPLAWTGVLEGFADRLRAQEAHVGRGPLATVEQSVAQRLDEEFRNERVVYEAHSPADR